MRRNHLHPHHGSYRLIANVYNGPICCTTKVRGDLVDMCKDGRSRMRDPKAFDGFPPGQATPRSQSRTIKIFVTRSNTLSSSVINALQSCRALWEPSAFGDLQPAQGAILYKPFSLPIPSTVIRHKSSTFLSLSHSFFG